MHDAKYIKMDICQWQKHKLLYIETQVIHDGLSTELDFCRVFLCWMLFIYIYRHKFNLPTKITILYDLNMTMIYIQSNTNEQASEANGNV